MKCFYNQSDVIPFLIRICLKRKRSPKKCILQVCFKHILNNVKLVRKCLFMLYYVTRVHVALLYFKSFMCTS